MQAASGKVFGFSAEELKTVITIDGPAGSGKSTVARLLAKRLGFFLLDSGALYRAMALHLTRNGIHQCEGPVPEEILACVEMRIEPAVGSMRLFLGDEDVTEQIRTEQISTAASKCSTRSEVRRALIQVQRSAASQWDLVAEGRDMGTVVFPDATVKFFLTADLEVRARRRYKELVERGEEPEFQQVRSDMASRDLRDQTRTVSPLVAASDALVVDTSDRGVEEVITELMTRIGERIRVPSRCESGQRDLE